MEDIVVNFIYNNYFYLIDIYFKEKKELNKEGVVFINMTNNRIKKQKINANFMQFELLPKHILERFEFKEDKAKTRQIS